MTPTIHTAADPTAIDATRTLLSHIGITATDLLTDSPAVPTFGQVIPKLRATLTPGTLRTYGTHLNWLETTWHNHPLDQISKPSATPPPAPTQAATPEKTTAPPPPTSKPTATKSPQHSQHSPNPTH